MRPATITASRVTAAATGSSHPSASGAEHAQTVPPPAPSTPQVASTGMQAPSAGGSASAPVSTAANTTTNPIPSAAPALPPYTPGGELDRIVSLADTSISVKANTRNTTARISKDHLQFRVGSNRAGYVYVFMVDPAGQYLMLFPNELDKNNRIELNREVVLPRAGWHITAGGPPGTDHIVAMVSRKPRDMTGIGVKKAGDQIPEIDLGLAEQLWAARQPAESPFAGKAVCEAGESPCDGSYGATLLVIDEVKK